jgi:hypothetical protein
MALNWKGDIIHVSGSALAKLANASDEDARWAVAYGIYGAPAEGGFWQEVPKSAIKAFHENDRDPAVLDARIREARETRVAEAIDAYRRFPDPIQINVVTRQNIRNFVLGGLEVGVRADFEGFVGNTRYGVKLKLARPGIPETEMRWNAIVYGHDWHEDDELTDTYARIRIEDVFSGVFVESETGLLIPEYELEVICADLRSRLEEIESSDRTARNRTST